VTAANVRGSNGVVHLIDTILDPPKSAANTAVNAGVFTGLVGALSDTALVSAVEGLRSATIFAPIDPSFDEVPGDFNFESLRNTLLYHVVDSTAFSTDLSDGQEIATLAGGAKLVVRIVDGEVFVNDARVLIPNVLTSSGVIHVIDRVLPLVTPEQTLLQNLQADYRTTSLVALLKSDAQYQPVLDLLGDSSASVTVFAPTNKAFTDRPIPADVNVNLVLYHALSGVVLAEDLRPLQFVPSLLKNQTLQISASGGQVQVIFGVPGDESGGTATVTAANVRGSNGVVHLIDTILDPPKSPVNTAVNAGVFTGLVDAITRARLANTVERLRCATIFAPIDPAFANVTRNTTRSRLQRVLLNHIVGDRTVFSTDLRNNQRITTLARRSIRVRIIRGEIFLNNARVVIPNVLTSTGVIHVIDRILW
jgi:transforming growth factor-beta-induced protein